MIEITINGKPEQIEQQTSIDRLLDQIGLAGQRVAVELNREIVPRSLHPDTRIQAGDRIEIVHAIGGG